MAKYVGKEAKGKISRRDFIKGSVAGAAALVGMAFFDWQASVVKSENTPSEAKSTLPADNALVAPDPEHAPITNPEAGGTWVSAACWHNCGGRCMNKVMVKDGIVIRQKTDDTHADSLEYPQQRSCLKGRSQQNQCFGADRLKYPMKRKHWEPLTGGQKELRGADEWERISWDEAYKYIADELKHCIDTYGNKAILAPGITSNNKDNLTNFLGGHVSVSDSCSEGSFFEHTSLLGYPSSVGDGNDRLDLKNADYIVLEGANPAWSALGTGLYSLVEAKKSGVQIVVVGPSYNASAQALDAKWIPVRPGTDMAFLLGVAYEMIQADVVDYDFLNKYAVGFDAEHMPSDAKTNENFKDYLMGEYDGIVKDAAWASAICGASVEDIQYMAQVMSKDNKTMFMYGFSIGRINGGENIPQLFGTLAFMGGHLGKSGHALGCVCDTGSTYNFGSRLVTSGGTGVKAPANPITDIIIGPQAWDAVLNGKYTYVGKGWGAGLSGGEDRTLDIHMLVCNYEGNYLQTGPNINKGIEAFRKVDFVVSRGIYMTTNCKYADIVLPVTTRWEREGGFLGANREWISLFTKVTEPLYEAKSDQEIDKGILEAMGYDPKELYPISEKAQFFNQILGCKVINAAGSEMETLVTVTQKDIDDWGVQEEMEAAGLTCAPQKGRVDLAKFLSDGGYQVPRKEGDGLGHIGFQAFVEDPEANPLPSASGKFEIYCQAKADVINGITMSDLEVKPYPNYFVPITGYEQTFVNGDITGKKGEYPYVMYNPRYIARSHSIFDNNRWLQAAFVDPIYISKADAKEKGVVNGDTVVVYNQYGRILRRVSILAGMMPGVVAIPHGSNLNMDEKNGIDRGGADNVLVGAPAYGMCVTGYNNNNCNFEKYNGEALALRHEIPQIIFED